MLRQLTANLVSGLIPHRTLRRKVRDTIRYTGNAKRRISERFEKMLGYPLNLKRPRTFNEKLNWLKFNYTNPLMTVCADKYRVREYIREKKLDHILVPLLDRANCFEELDWASLPERFVLKTNHNSGGVWIVKDKKTQDREILHREINDALSRTFGLWSHELHYSRIKPVVIAEQYLEDNRGELHDYKLFCFNGTPGSIQVDFDRFTNHTRTFYDLAWNNLRFSTEYPVAEKTIEQPKNLSEMVSTAAALSADFPFVRVDLYCVNDKLYFGELTFCHGAGWEKFSDFTWDQKMGDLLKLPTARKE